jgi:hypothetical protein
VMVDGRIVSESARDSFDDENPADDVGEQLQYAEHKLSAIIQKAHAHV